MGHLQSSQLHVEFGVGFNKLFVFDYLGLELNLCPADLLPHAGELHLHRLQCSLVLLFESKDLFAGILHFLLLYLQILLEGFLFLLHFAVLLG